MTRAHTHGGQVSVDLPEGVREREIWGGKEPSCWGLGWRVNHPGTELKFGAKEGLTYGHHGVSLPALSCPLLGRMDPAEAGADERAFGSAQAVGAMIWIEPESGVSLCVASPEPDMCYSEEFNLLSDKLREGIR